MDLSLPTPDAFPMFPYITPYNIQLQFMRHLFMAIEDRKFAILESPTGTGKSLSLLTGALTWLLDEKDRSQKATIAAFEASVKDDTTPPWVIEQSVEFQKRRMQLDEQDLQERLQRVRQKEESLRRMEHARVTKRRKVDHDVTEEEQPEDVFLPEDSTDDNLSPEVKELMRKLDQSRTKDHTSTELEPTCTKIFYASRTHSQLSQLHGEFLKLKDPSDPCSIGPVARVVSLGSRKNLCINEELRRRGGDLDEGCRELMSEKGKKRCPHLPPPEEETRMLDLRDHILATPRDIEDLLELGKELGTCPYYGSRRAIPQAQLVALPYNLLLQRNSREALGIDLSDHVVIIDEAHNLIDSILGIHTVQLSSNTLKVSLLQLKLYVQRFRKRLTPRHLIHLRRLVEFLAALNGLCDARLASSTALSESMYTVSDFVSSLGSKVEGVNLVEIEAYLRSSKIARKISGYSDKEAEKESNGASDRRKGTTPPLHAVETFILTLTNANEDGRVVINVWPPAKDGSGAGHVVLKYQLLNPSREFREVVDSARSVILAGGTMAPVSDFSMQLVPYLSLDRVSIFSCGHVIPTENLKTLVVTRGPTGKELVYKHQQQKDPSIVTELGQILFNFTNLVPDGMVVFVPSYAFLNTIKRHWETSGMLSRFAAKKTVLFEPQDGGSVDGVLKEYADQVKEKAEGKTGALLFAVVGAKLSEGLNFSDGLARAVIIVGLPFANLGSIELKERMRYVTELERKARPTNNENSGGMELYENLCMKAVNQSIGRAIRHQKDWAALILLDQRYSTARIRTKLPGWIRDSVIVAEGFGQGIKELGQFFRARK